MNDKPILGITMGDAAGIGPELILKLSQHKKILENIRPLIFGNLRVMEWYKAKFDIPISFNAIQTPTQAKYDPSVLDIIDSGEFHPDSVEVGKILIDYGKEAVFYTKAAAQCALDGSIDAIISAPLNKEAMRLAGYPYEGQTQIFGEMSHSNMYGMILLIDTIRVMMLTTHVSLMDACQMVTEERVYNMINLAASTLKAFGIENPVVGVSALNPHSGEGGLFGREEITAISPAIARARKEGIQVLGPIPADVIFVKAKQDKFDIVLCMYHDQANMAVKLMGFGSVVTLVAGIPFIRTSVGHGTAFDIAGTGKADETNFIAAVQQATELALKRGKVK